MTFKSKELESQLQNLWLSTVQRYDIKFKFGENKNGSEIQQRLNFNLVFYYCYNDMVTSNNCLLNLDKKWILNYVYINLHSYNKPMVITSTYWRSLEVCYNRTWLSLIFPNEFKSRKKWELGSARLSKTSRRVLASVQWTTNHLSSFAIAVCLFVCLLNLRFIKCTKLVLDSGCCPITPDNSEYKHREKGSEKTNPNILTFELNVSMKSFCVYKYLTNI